MGKFSRDKGKRFERACVIAAKAFGLDARRTAPNQASADAEESDVLIAGRKCECKHRENISKELWAWREGNAVVLLKRNNHEPLAVLSMVDYFALLLAADGKTAPADAQFVEVE